MYKMLVVDDNAEFRESLKQMLLSHFPSHKVYEAESVEETMRQIVSKAPNLIFISIRFSYGTTLELCKYIKSRYPEIEIILTSNFDLPEYRQAAINLGAKYFMSKDSLPDEIYAYLSAKDKAESL
jgi:DNA-binding NarL/FixJ family response regulator